MTQETERAAISEERLSELHALGLGEGEGPGLIRHGEPYVRGLSTAELRELLRSYRAAREPQPAADPSTVAVPAAAMAKLREAVTYHYNLDNREDIGMAMIVRAARELVSAAPADRVERIDDMWCRCGHQSKDHRGGIINQTSCLGGSDHGGCLCAEFEEWPLPAAQPAPSGEGVDPWTILSDLLDGYMPEPDDNHSIRPLKFDRAAVEAAERALDAHRAATAAPRGEEPGAPYRSVASHAEDNDGGAATEEEGVPR